MRKFPTKTPMNKLPGIPARTRRQMEKDELESAKTITNKKKFTIKSNSTSAPIPTDANPKPSAKSTRAETWPGQPHVPLYCPLQPNTRICGCHGVDPKGKWYDVCILPDGHKGPHNSNVQQPEVPRNVERELVVPSSIAYDLTGETIPSELTNILYAWRKCGNQAATCLETQLMCYSKGLVFEHNIDNLPAVNALWYLGFLERIEPRKGSMMEPVKYKLTKKGLKATDEIARLIGDTKTETVSTTEEEIDCSECDGEGFVNGSVCNHCGGTGTEPIRKKADRVSPPEKTAAKPKFKPTSNKLVDCGRCGGEGILSKEDVGVRLGSFTKGSVCPNCEGLGETTDRTNRSWSDHIVISDAAERAGQASVDSAKKKFAVRRK